MVWATKKQTSFERPHHYLLSITFFWGGLPSLQCSCEAKKEARKKKHRGRKKEETSVALRYHHHGKQRNTKTRETGAVFVSW